MPFLKSYKEPRSRVLEESTKKNGLRHAIFNIKGDKYVGEWKNNLKHGKNDISSVMYSKLKNQTTVFHSLFLSILKINNQRQIYYVSTY